MKKIVLSLAMIAGVLPAWATDVGVSVSVNQPGVYGRIDIGHVPQPPTVVYPQPVIIQPAPVAVHQQPIYLHVPPGHSKNWRKHCHEYNACGQRVYFVKEQWYQTVYVPSKRDHDHHRDHDHGKKHKHGKGHKHDD